MDAHSPEAEAMAERATQEGSNDVHAGALGIGAALGAIAAAVWAGSMMLLIVLAFGAALGAVIAGGIAFIGDLVRGRSRRSGDHAPPGLTAGAGPAAQRAEAGATSPSSS
jgi:hypothetical protein